MIKNKNDRYVLIINKSRWTVMMLSVIVFAALIEPTYISGQISENVRWVYRILKYVIAISVVAVYIIRRGKLDMLLLSTLIFEGILSVSTLVNGGDMYVWVRTCAYCIVLLLFVQMVFPLAPGELLKAIAIVLGLYIHINTLTWILYPDGLYVNSIGYENCWFLGYDNAAAATIVLAETVALYRIVSGKKGLKIWDWSVLISGIVFIFGTLTATAVVAEVTAVLFLLLTRKEKIRRVIGKARIIVLGMVGLFLLIQFFSVQEIPVFSMIFLLLGKDFTFTGRTRFWRMAWKDIMSKHFLLGMGMQTEKKIAIHFGSNAIVHLHSYYLQVFYEGGILAFGGFVFMLMQAARRFDKGEKDFSDMVLLAGLVAFMMMWQTEAYGNLLILFFILLSLLYNAPLLKRQNG